MIMEPALVSFGEIYSERQRNSNRSGIHRTRTVNHGKCVFIVAEIFEGVPRYVHCVAFLCGQPVCTPFEARSNNIIRGQYARVHFALPFSHCRYTRSSGHSRFHRTHHNISALRERAALNSQRYSPAHAGGFQLYQSFSQCDNCFTVLHFVHSEQMCKTACRAYRFLV